MGRFWVVSVFIVLWGSGGDFGDLYGKYVITLVKSEDFWRFRGVSAKRAVLDIVRTMYGQCLYKGLVLEIVFCYNVNKKREIQA